MPTSDEGGTLNTPGSPFSRPCDSVEKRGVEAASRPAVPGVLGARVVLSDSTPQETVTMAIAVKSEMWYRPPYPHGAHQTTRHCIEPSVGDFRSHGIEGKLSIRSSLLLAHDAHKQLE
jgi:hypothetical protein